MNRAALEALRRLAFSLPKSGKRSFEARAFRKQDIKGDHIVFAVTFGRKQELKEVKD